MGDQGMGIIDATTLALDEAASAPFLSPYWWDREHGSAIFVLAMPASPGSSSTANATAAATTATLSGRVIVAGLVPRWGNRVAGNVVRATVVPDITRPTTTVPTAGVRGGAATSSTSVQARIGWSGADPGGSGVRRYEVSMSTSGGPFTVVSTTVLSRRRPT